MHPVRSKLYLGETLEFSFCVVSNFMVYKFCKSNTEMSCKTENKWTAENDIFFSCRLVCLTFQKAEPPKDKESQAVHNAERRHPSSSFVDSVMVALTVEKEDDVNRETSPGPAGTVAHPTCDDVIFFFWECNSYQAINFYDIGRLARFFWDKNSIFHRLFAHKSSQSLYLCYSFSLEHNYLLSDWLNPCRWSVWMDHPASLQTGSNVGCTLALLWWTLVPIGDES